MVVSRRKQVALTGAFFHATKNEDYSRLQNDRTVPEEEVGVP